MSITNNKTVLLILFTLVTINLIGCSDSDEPKTLPETGLLTVFISPLEANTAGAQWRVDDGTWKNSGATETGLSPGAHTVDFKDIPGWITPNSRNVTIQSAQTATINGTYTQQLQTGSLTVVISPPEANTAGAQWRVDGGTWKNSGATETGLSPGAHTIDFKDIAGWITPNSRNVIIQNNVNTIVNGTYYVDAKEVILSNDYVRLIFNRDNYSLQTIKDIPNGHTFTFQGIVPLWGLRLLNTRIPRGAISWDDPDHFSEVSALTDGVSETRRHEIADVSGGQRLRMFWEDISLPYGGTATVTAEVFLAEGDSETRWDLFVEMDSETSALWRAEYPSLGLMPIGDDPADDAAIVPSRGGFIVRNPHAHKAMPPGGSEVLNTSQIASAHPGHWSFQYMQIYDELSGQGLFLRSDDTEGYLKSILLYGISSNFTIMAWRHYPENNHRLTQGSYTPDYSVYVRPLKGDWYDGARYYRQWLVNQPWLAKGPVRTREDFPRELAENTIISTLAALPELQKEYSINEIDKVVSLYTGWLNYLGDDSDILSLHLRNTGVSAPDYPVSTYYRLLVNALTDAGIRVKPYTNTHWYFAAFEDSGNNVRARSRLLSLNNEPLYVTDFNAFMMNPGMSLWREEYLKNVMAHLDVGATDLYLDLYVRPNLSFDEEQGTPLGGGNWWYLGYRRMIADVRAAARERVPDFMMSPEHRDETMLDLFDAYWSRDWSFLSPEKRYNVPGGIPVPVLPAVYHDYILTTNSVETPYEELAPDQFRFIQAYSFVHGNLLTVGKDLPPEMADYSIERLSDYAYLRDLIRHRQAALPYLLYGEYLRPPDTGSGFQNVMIWDTPVRQPVIMSGAFRAGDGTVGIFLTNYNRDERTADLTINHKDYELTEGPYRVFRIRPDVSPELMGEFAGENFRLSHQLTPGEILALVIVTFASDNEKPLIGVHGTSDPTAIEELGAQMSRVILHDRAIANARQAIEAGEMPAAFASIEGLERFGVTPVITLRWPVNPGEGFNDPDRVPTGQDREEALDLLDWFLLATAGRVNHVAINNEPQGGPGHYPREQMAEGLAWMATVAERMKELRTVHPELAGLRIIIPIQIPSGYLEGIASPGTVATVEALIEIGAEHADLFDLHLHVRSIEEMERKLACLTGLTDVPLITLEWSQAFAYDAWRAERADPRFGTGTNNDVILAAYEKPMATEDWAAFIATSPWDTDFMPQAVEVMAGYGVQMAAYGAVFQYGNPRFDIRALFANRTVGGRTPNEPFYSAFCALNQSTIKR